MHAGMSGVILYDGPDLKLFILVGWRQTFFVYCLTHRGSTGDSLLLQFFSGVVQLAAPPGRKNFWLLS